MIDARTPADTPPVSPEGTETNPRRRSRGWLRSRRSPRSRDRRETGGTETRPETAEVVKAALRRDRRRATRTGPETETDQLPQWMTVSGLWLDRIIGTLPLLAPLAVSGWYTYHVGADETGLHLPGLIAFALTLALEGGAWKLAGLLEKHLVSGTSTIAVRLGLGAYLAIISSLIYWHATQQERANVGARTWTDAVGTADSRPALAVAGMCALGVFIWSRTARWRRRAELAAAGKLDTQAIKLSALSWVMTPIINFKTLRHAVKYRIDSTPIAVADYRLWRAAGKPSAWVPQLDETDPETDETELSVPAGWSRPPVPGDHPLTAPVSAPPVPPVSPVPTRSGPRPPAPAPAGPRPVSVPDPYVRHADRITAVQTAVPEWRDRSVTTAEVMTATGLAGKKTALEVRSLIERLAGRETETRGSQ